MPWRAAAAPGRRAHCSGSGRRGKVAGIPANFGALPVYVLVDVDI